MCCQSLLTVSAALHGLEYVHEAPHRANSSGRRTPPIHGCSTISLSEVRLSISNVLGPSPARLGSRVSVKKGDSAASILSASRWIVRSSDV